MIEQLYLSLILIGITIGAVLLYLWRQAHRINSISLALIRLNEQLEFDTPSLLRDAWPLLSQAGLHGIAWRLDWFGAPMEGYNGSESGLRLHREIRVAEMRLDITIYRRSTRGERRYFDEALIETFLLLLRTDMSIKAGATDATVRQMARLNLFLQHDIKNIAQFIQLMSDQLTAIPDGKEQLVLNHLRVAAPLVRLRADRIVRTLTIGQPHQESPRTMQLRHVLEQLCQLYRLEYAISGNADIRAPENSLDSALDNILKNYSDLALRDPACKPLVGISIADHAHAVEIAIAAENTPIAQFERLFEPFWSSDPAGLGIGLYQAKQTLEMHHGSLTAEKTGNGSVRFQLRFPKPNEG